VRFTSVPVFQCSSMSQSLFYAKDEVQNPRGLKLIDFNKGKLAISEEGSRVLSELSPEQATNLMFIFGNARSGKSFLMNCLLGVPSAFKVVNSSEPCTRGVDISSYVAKRTTIASKIGLMDGEDKASDMNVGFVDVEGQGAEDGTYDTMLALPLLLTSKVVLFNHKGAPTVTDMLSKLGVLARAADYIELADENHAEEEEKEEEPGKKKFGHLHVVFRDFSFEGNRESVYTQLMGMEKVPKSLKTAPGQLDATKAAKERNDIRQMLLDNFQSVNVWLFKQPASADDLRNHKDLPASLVDPDFVKDVNSLLLSILPQLREPTLFQGKALTGPKLLSLIGQVSLALNEGGIVNVPSVYRAMEREQVNKQARLALAAFEKVTEHIRQNLPLSSEELSERIEKARQIMLHKFDSELTECPLEDEKKLKREEIIGAALRVEDGLVRDNAEATLKKIKQVVTQEFGKARVAFENFCRANMPMPDAKELQSKLNGLKDIAKQDIAAALSSLPQAMKLNDFHIMVLECEESLQEFLTLKTIENDSSLKDATIEKLREEAIQRQKLLIEQNKKLEQYILEEKKNTEDMESKLMEMRVAKEEEEKKAAEFHAVLEAQTKELEVLRKKRSQCVIL